MLEISTLVIEECSLINTSCCDYLAQNHSVKNYHYLYSDFKVPLTDIQGLISSISNKNTLFISNFQNFDTYCSIAQVKRERLKKFDQVSYISNLMK